MVRNRLLQFLPSILVAVALLVTAYLVERQNNQVLVEARRQRVIGLTNHARIEFERLVDRNIHLAQGLAAHLTAADARDQARFAALVAQDFPARPELLRVELARRGVTRLVHPLYGNESRVGRSSPTVGGELDSTGWPVLVPWRGADPVSEDVLALVLTVPIRSTQRSEDESPATLSVFLDPRALLAQAGIPDPEGQTAFAVVLAGDAGGVTSGVFGDPAIANATSVTAELSVPQQIGTIYARPVGGWTENRQGSLRYRIGLALLGVTIFVPAFVANWFAVARRRTIADLAAAETRLDGVLQNMPGAVFTYTMVGSKEAPGPGDRIRFFNRDWCRRIWGVEPSDAESDVMTLWRRGSDPDAMRALYSEFSRSATELRPWHFVWPILRSDGAQRWLDGRGHPTRLEDGSTRWFNLVVDATDEVLAKQELEHQRDLAHHAQKMESIGKLTGGVAHDFNNLLAIVMGNQELLREALRRDPSTGGDLVAYVDATLTATERGADLTRKMLSFAQRARLEPAVLDINEIVRETHAWAGRTLPANIRLETSLGTGLPLVRVDRASAESALLNLIVNARDAMPDGGDLTISTRAFDVPSGEPAEETEGLAPGRYVRLVVQDTGTGIATEIVPKIFEPFFSTKPLTAGSGLGLSMVHGFMEQSGGTVRVLSRVGEGTAFHLYFRALEAGSAGSGPTRRRVPASGGAERVLLVEDEADLRRVLASTLSRSGYHVVSAGSGDEAFEIFKGSPDFDLLLTDMVMPGSLQGTDLANAIRGMAPGIPVVFLSGHDNLSGGDITGFRKGDVRLTKPVSRDELVAAIDDALARTSEGYTAHS